MTSKRPYPNCCRARFNAFNADDGLLQTGFVCTLQPGHDGPHDWPGGDIQHPGILPVEHKIEPEALYQSPRNTDFTLKGKHMTPADREKNWTRFAPVAQYDPQPEQPTHIGAHVKDANDQEWVLVAELDSPNDQDEVWVETVLHKGNARWRASRTWRSLPQPVKILNHGAVAPR